MTIFDSQGHKVTSHKQKLECMTMQSRLYATRETQVKVGSDLKDYLLHFSVDPQVPINRDYLAYKITCFKSFTKCTFTEFGNRFWVAAFWNFISLL